MNDELPDGFYIPLHRSLTEPVLLGGAPRSATILNGTFTAAAVMGLGSLWGLPFGLILHLFLVSACKSDPEIVDVLLQNIKQPSKLDV